MSIAISGLNTTLYCGDSATALTKLCDIKDVPDLISDPNLLDATTLSDGMQKQILASFRLTPKPLPRTTTRPTTPPSRLLVMTIPLRATWTSTTP